MSTYVFSVIIAVYNVENYLREAIDSILLQDYDFDKIQLILVDDGSTDSSKEIALEYQYKYPDNITVLSKENGGPGSARNLGLKYAKGKYIHFFDGDDKIYPSVYSTVYNLFEKNDEVDMVAIPIVFFERREGNHPLNPKFKDESQIIDIIDNPNYIQLSGASSFLRFSAINDIRFNEDLVNGADALFLNQVLLNNKKYALVGLNDNAIYYYRKRVDSSSTLDTAKNKDGYFTDKLRYFSKNLLSYSIEKEGYVLDYIKYVVAYDLQGLVRSPDFPDSFGNTEINEFWDCLREVLNLIDVDIIRKHEFLSPHVKYFLIYIKNNEFHIDVRPNKKQVFLKSNNINISNLHNHKLFFDYFELRDGFLDISGNFLSRCNNDAIRIIAERRDQNKNIEIFKGSYLDYCPKSRRTQKFLSIDWVFSYNFEFKIPVDKDKIYSIVFKVVFDEGDKEVVMTNEIIFRNYCNISECANYFVKDSQIIIFENNMFYHVPYSYFKLLKLSIKAIINNIRLGDLFRIKYILLYLIFFPLMSKKKIWLFGDRPTIADDNGKHLFSYSVKQDDNIEKYFVIDKNSKDFKKMKAIDKNIVPFGSFKHKLLFIFADKLIYPFLTIDFLNPFVGKPFFRSFVTSGEYFLQHGVIKDDLSCRFNKFVHNVRLFLTSADLERQSLIDNPYNYDESIIPVLGLPRFDNLKSTGKRKEILFMPSWRNYLPNKTSILNSKYYKRINSFLNNKKLIDFLNENDYLLIFKPHPELLEYKDIFDLDENIKISIDESYQELFNNSSLMVTDYSSVYFDFAYLKKPVIYYHKDKDYHYNEGYFDYETMGFGDVIYSEEELVDRIIEYIENDCVMEDKYKERVDKFFKFTDQNNCKRVYEWIYNN